MTDVRPWIEQRVARGPNRVEAAAEHIARAHPGRAAGQRLLVDASHCLERARTLGVEDDCRYAEEEAPFGLGDLLFAFTDGLSEAMNVKGELYGEERLRELVEENGRSADELRDHVLAEVRRFVGEAPQHDDMTMVVIKID